MIRFLKSVAFVISAVIVLADSSPECRAQDPFARYDLMMDHDPDFPVQGFVQEMGEGVLELWETALKRDEPALQRMVLDSVTIAYRREVNVDQLKPTIVQLLNNPEQSIHVARAAASTLIAIDARDQTATLADAVARHGISLGNVVEPALSRWESPAMKDTWLSRIENGGFTESQLMLAIEGAGQLKLAESAKTLTSFVTNQRKSPRLRMASARALAKLGDESVVSTAQSIVDQSDDETLTAILACELLRNQSNDQTVEIISRLAKHEQSAVQAAALSILLDIDSNHVIDFIDDAIKSPDVNVRRPCVDAIVDQKIADRMTQLAMVLDDVNPSLRRHVAAELIRLADDDSLKNPVIEAATDILNGNSWRGCEQACFVLTKLDHKASGRRMVELLKHERGEVRVATAWGLTQLRVESLLPDMVEHGMSVFQAFKSGKMSGNSPGYTTQMAHLFMAFGNQDYKPADKLIRLYLPKDFSLGADSRAGAYWAAGKIHRDDPPADIVKMMITQLSDTESFFPEVESVRRMCLAGLYFTNAKEGIPAIRKYARGMDHMSLACFFCLEKLAGEPMPEIPEARFTYDDWILIPLTTRK